MFIFAIILVNLILKIIIFKVFIFFIFLSLIYFGYLFFLSVNSFRISLSFFQFAFIIP
jgi:hypothetical protein